MSSNSPRPSAANNAIVYEAYSSEKHLPAMIALIQKDLSEPYCIYTYRYFLQPPHSKLCFLAFDGEQLVGTIICKIETRLNGVQRGYIAMLAVDASYRGRRIGSNLVQCAVRAMIEQGADEVVLETEVTNKAALALYENLGFVRDKRLQKYYLNGVDAFRLKLFLSDEQDRYS